MPNWVYNGLTAQGPHASIKKMKDQLNTPFVDYIEATGDLAYSIKETKYSNPVFSFRNIIGPTDLEAYRKQPSFEDRGNDNSWYNWNLRNWGAKWDVAVSDEDKYPETYMEDTEDEATASVYYHFNTAWGIPDEALTNLSSQYPDILFTLSYEEETGWGGEHEYLRGERIEGSEYNWKCKECDYEELGEPPFCDTCEFDMCPSCGWGEPMDEDRAQCQTHMLESDTTQQKENA
jgi:hypothetical protein